VTHADLAEFETLLQRRELAAVTCVTAIQFVLLMFEAQDFEPARKYLQDALDQHKAIDQAIAAFHARHFKKENQSDGNRSSSSAA
jgi:hypothetical protein